MAGLSDALRDRVRGAILGTLLGDALGAPFEGASPGPSHDEAVARRSAKPNALLYTDDGEMTLGIAESIVEARGFAKERAMTCMLRNHEPARGYGKGMNRIFDALRGGTSLDELATTSWGEGSRGNGAAVRVAPIACFFHGDESALAGATDESAAMTHSHPESRQGAVIFARAIGCLLRGQEIRLEQLAIDAPEYREKLSTAGALLGRKATRAELASRLGTGVLAIDSVPLAIAIFLSKRHDPSEAILDAVRAGGDTDTIGAMTGALCGAAHGASSIRGEWSDVLEARAHAIELADAIIELAP